MHKFAQNHKEIGPLTPPTKTVYFIHQKGHGWPKILSQAPSKYSANISPFLLHSFTSFLTLLLTLFS